MERKMNKERKKLLLSLLTQWKQSLNQKSRERYIGKKYQKIELYGHKFEIKFVNRVYFTAQDEFGGMGEEYEDYFDIYVDEKKVGSANIDQYMGVIQGKMWRRHLPDLGHYNSSAKSVPDHFKAFITK